MAHLDEIVDLGASADAGLTHRGAVDGGIGLDLDVVFEDGGTRLVDAQYIPGFDWLRNPEIRVVKDWNKEYWLGVEAASPQAIFGGTNQGLGGLNVATLPGSKNPITVPLQLAIGQRDIKQRRPTGLQRAPSSVPDVTVKAAWDPHGGGWGHYEVFGLARGFRDRVDPGSFGTLGTNATLNIQNNQEYGFSGGGGAIVPLWGDKLQLQGNVLYGQGIGRYDAAQLPDATINAAGDVVPLTGIPLWLA